MDTHYIRPYMDVEGYIPIAYLCNFPNVLNINAAYEDILAAFEQNANPDKVVAPAVEKVDKIVKESVVEVESNPTPTEAAANTTTTPTKTETPTPAPISPTLYKKYETKVDFDRDNELIRLKENWKMVRILGYERYV